MTRGDGDTGKSEDRPDTPHEQETLLQPPGGATGGDGDVSSSGSLGGGRFPPGAILDGRYRLVDLLGRGGMGEVYRAEDLKLGEAVALKLLPPELSTDGPALARLHQEVRLARRISHKNVVRVHDVGEADGLPFIAMEYIDGENLESLLKRIGRLPEAKALELARELCAGLAAAHERGLVHRDVKPANIMVDGEGHAKISDFGLAGLAADLERPELAGTPLYMAPEQLAEGRATFASDVWSLGLMLYEMFSGERPFRATTRGELVAEHRDSDPPSLSSTVDRVDPLVEAAVGRCLARDPRQRPGSPLEVAAMLPGGDPLAAALAAGETPSPEIVAQATGQAALSRPLAAGLLALTVLSTLFIVAWQDKLAAPNLDDPLPPEVLAHQAREQLAAAGWAGGHERWGWAIHHYHWRHTRLDESAGQEWAEAMISRRPTALEFWLRSSPLPLAPTLKWRGRVTPEDPPPGAAGVATVRLDSRGRLETLSLPPATASRDSASPLPSRAAPAPDEPPDWDRLFEAAGLEAADMRPVEPRRAPPFYADRLYAWEGSYPGQEEPALRVHAATTDGAFVWWQVGTEPASEGGGADAASRPTVLIALVVFALVLVLGGWLAWRHQRDGRGDLRGAWRLAGTMAATNMVVWLLLGHHVATPAELSLMNDAIAESALLGLAFWILYLALEPYARRLIPRRLTSWTRLLSGRFGDPLVGRDLLLGLSASAASLMVLVGSVAARDVIGWAYPHGLAALHGARFTLANSISILNVIVPLVVFGIFVAVRALVRSDRWAPLAFLLVLAPIHFAANGVSVPGLLVVATLAALAAYSGLVALLGFAIVNINLNLVPVSLNPDLWWAARSWPGIAVVLALAAWSYHTATRGAHEATPPGG